MSISRIILCRRIAFSIGLLSVLFTPPAGAESSETRPWQPLPSRAAEAGFRYHPSPMDWRDVSIYQVFTDRFSDGDPSNNRANPTATVNPFGSDAVHGGDFAGLEQKLDYMDYLGFHAIWISPVNLNERGRYHGYAALDFNQVDPHWGSLDELRHFIDQAHARGMYVILDVVFNHLGPVVTSSDPGYPAWNPDGYELQWRDPEHIPPPPFDQLSWFHNHGNIEDWQDPDQSVRGAFLGLADLATERPDVRAALVDSFFGLIAATDCDGFRIDTVRHVEVNFWSEVLPELRRRAAKLGKNNFLLFGEVWSSRDELLIPYVGPDKFHSILDFPWRRKVMQVFFDGAPAGLLLERREIMRRNYPPVAHDHMVTWLDNHDKPRLLHLDPETGPERMTAALTYQFMQGDIPCVYYGTEQGFNGSNEPANREDMFAGGFESGPSVGDNFDVAHGMAMGIRRLNLLRDAYSALRKGTFTVCTNVVNPDPHLLAFERTHEDQSVLVLINPADQAIRHRLRQAEGSEPWVHPLTGIAWTNGPLGTIEWSLPPRSATFLVNQSSWSSLPPTLTGIRPAHDSQNTEPVRDIELWFDDAMNTESVERAFRLEPVRPGTTTWSDDGKRLQYHLDEPLSGPGQTTVHLAGTAASRAGLVIGAPVTSWFYTGQIEASRPPLGPWTLDGVLDPGATLLAGNRDMTLHVDYAPDPGVLYVAATDAGEGFDHFVFVTDQPLADASVEAPWSKAGFIASDGPFLADENDNEFSAWRKVDTEAGSRTGPNGGVVEGVLNIRQQFGDDIHEVYLAAAAYETAEQGALNVDLQAPAPVVRNRNIEPAEYIRYSLDPTHGH